MHLRVKNMDLKYLGSLTCGWNASRLRSEFALSHYPVSGGGQGKTVESQTTGFVLRGYFGVGEGERDPHCFWSMLT